MNRQESYAAAGYVTVEVRAEARISDLPAWVDSREICNAAIREYERQREIATGGLPMAATAEAYG